MSSVSGVGEYEGLINSYEECVWGANIQPSLLRGLPPCGAGAAANSNIWMLPCSFYVCFMACCIGVRFPFIACLLEGWGLGDGGVLDGVMRGGVEEGLRRALLGGKRGRGGGRGCMDGGRRAAVKVVGRVGKVGKGDMNAKIG